MGNIVCRIWTQRLIGVVVFFSADDTNVVALLPAVILRGSKSLVDIVFILLVLELPPRVVDKIVAAAAAA